MTGADLPIESPEPVDSRQFGEASQSVEASGSVESAASSESRAPGVSALKAPDARGASGVSGLEIEPAVAARLFGARIDVARAFTTNLAMHGEEYGLIGPLELPRLWSRHILNSAIVAPLLRAGRVGDVGSGAGLPGLVLAIARPDVEFVLIEPMERRVKWLEDQSAVLQLDNVTVIRGRAEDVNVDGGLDQLTARAVSAFSKLIPMCVPLVKRGGELVLMKGAGAVAEVEAAQKQIRRFKLADVEVLELGQGVLQETTRVIRATVA